MRTHIIALYFCICKVFKLRVRYLKKLFSKKKHEWKDYQVRLGHATPMHRQGYDLYRIHRVNSKKVRVYKFCYLKIIMIRAAGCNRGVARNGLWEDRWVC